MAPQISPIIILLAAVLTSNILLVNFLGMCSFIACSRQIKTAFGRMTISAIEKLCVEQRKIMDKRLGVALKQRDAEGFAKDTKGDEKLVIKREGVPSRIENFAGGRIFIYERFNKRGLKELKRFGEDGTIEDAGEDTDSHRVVPREEASA